jgi:hypothetical protein
MASQCRDQAFVTAEYGRTPSVEGPAAPSGLHGMENENEAPGPSFADAQIRPRWLSMIERLTDSPIPIPPSFVV